MTHTSRQSLRSRLLATSLGILLFSAVVISIAVFWNYNRLAKDALQARVRIESEIISQNLAVSVLFDDEKTALEILNTYKADSAVLHVKLDLVNGNIFTTYAHDNYSPKNTNVFYVREPIFFEDQLLGFLNVTVSKHELQLYSTALFVFLTIVLGLVVILSYALSRPIIQSMLLPLLHLHEISEQIAKTRNYTLRAEVKSKDEVGRLSQTFNYMVEQIEHRDAMLEKQVRQRTHELEKLAEEFRFRAFHDSLTGLPNRALLNERFEQNVKYAQRNDSIFACLLLDLDDFKTINDTKGHEFGDELLIEVANRLKSTVREIDLVCRLGGDEFVILLSAISDAEDTTLVARKILAQVSREFCIKNDRVRTAASIGCAIFPVHGDNMSAIKRHADVAMYKAKDSGKNQFCLFSQGMQEDVKHRLLIQNDLRPGLIDKQFEVYMQPKVNPVKNIVVGCEALVRWNHPKEGFLTPNRFIPYAEEVGLVNEIDYFVIRDCCATIVDWNAIFTKPIPIAFNLSGRHFHDFKIVSVLEHAINEFHIDPSLLEVEITEAVLIQDPDKAQNVVRAIKSLGLGISLDDFGTGYSSLNYLRTLPIDTVKLDKSFVSNLDKNAQDKRLTKGIVSLTQGLALKLVAEGVETQSQLNELLNLGCTTMQGYYFLRPAKKAEFIHWYLRNFSLREALSNNQNNESR